MATMRVIYKEMWHDRLTCTAAHDEIRFVDGGIEFASMGYMHHIPFNLVRGIEPMTDETEAEVVARYYSRQLIAGDFAEGSYVTVRIGDEQYTRKVKYSAKKWGDMYITVNGNEYTYQEFIRPEDFEVWA